MECDLIAGGNSVPGSKPALLIISLRSVKKLIKIIEKSTGWKQSQPTFWSSEQVAQA